MAWSRRGLLLAAGAGVLAAPGLVSLVARRGGVETGAREDCLWTSEAPSMPAAPRFEGERKVDLAIVGGGYTGLACAYYTRLFRPDWSVIVLESHRLGSGASSRNSGAVYANQVGISDVGMLQRGLDRLMRFIEAEQIDCDLAPASTLRLFTSSRSAERARAELAPGERWISPDELHESIGSEYYAGAVDAPDFFRVQPAKLVVGHVAAARRVGAELFEHSPALSVEPGRPARIATPHGRVLADHVFLATNAHTPRLGFFRSSMFPVHQYSLATRKLTSQEIAGFGLDRWMLRFERSLLPVTFSLTPGGHFFVRIVLGYASFDSCEWADIDGAQRLARQIFEQRYPRIADVELAQGWQGVTGHTALFRQIAGAVGDGNIHVSAAYNGLGIMPGHNNGYLTACRITGRAEDDTRYLTGVSGQIPLPGEFYRSLVFKPFMRLMTPV
ncbi:MAG: FAD-dependent oxidoreductase [Myxococcota bacterium]|nr:FAD-dependent oxidoreductase [Myxococcota bacterium]